MIDAQVENESFDVVYRDWLIARRLDNQRTSLRLHVLIRTHAVRISESENLTKATMGLVKAASSLWRAACLSDRLAAYDDLEDEDFFLTDGIIQREFTADSTARAAPDWPFFFHMSNARNALISIASSSEPQLVTRAEIPTWVGSSYKECWVCHQALLDRAVTAFEVACGLALPAADAHRADVAVTERPRYHGNGLPS